MTFEELQEAIDIQTLDPDALVCIQCKDMACFGALGEHLKELSDALDDEGIFAIIVPPGFELKNLPDEEMKKHGWVRDV